MKRTPLLFLLLGGVVGLGLGTQTSRPRAETGVKPDGFAVSLRAENDVTARAPGRRPRPSDVPAGSVVTSEAPNEFQLYNDYATPERSHASPRVVVHSVERGIDAPPLNDDDGDLVPDYVERVGEAADTAIVYYEQRGFRAIRPDSGGGDTRPDLYVSRPSLPGWALEGSVVALEGRMFPDLDDLVWELQLEPWLRTGADMPRFLVVHLPDRGAPAVTLSYQVESAIPGNPCRSGRLRARAAADGRTLRFWFPAALRTSRRVPRPTLIVSNGSPTASAAFAVTIG